MLLDIVVVVLEMVEEQQLLVVVDLEKVEVKHLLQEIHTFMDQVVEVELEYMEKELVDLIEQLHLHLL